jgi:hypothetical protein
MKGIFKNIFLTGHSFLNALLIEVIFQSPTTS